MRVMFRVAPISLLPARGNKKKHQRRPILCFPQRCLTLPSAVGEGIAIRSVPRDERLGDARGSASQLQVICFLHNDLLGLVRLAADDGGRD